MGRAGFGPTAAVGADRPAPAVSARPDPATATATATTVLRIGGEPVEVGLTPDPDGRLRGELSAAGLTAGGVRLHSLVLDDGPPGASGGWASGPVDGPFVRGTARFRVGADGTLTGQVAVDSAVTVLGTALARLAYTGQAWPGAGLPVPHVTVDAGSARVAVPGALLRGPLSVDTGAGPAPMAGGDLVLPLPAGFTGTPTEGAPPAGLAGSVAEGAPPAGLAGSVAEGAPPARLAGNPAEGALPTGTPTEGAAVPGSVGEPLDATVADRIARVLRVSLDAVRVHRDQAAAAGADRLGTPGFTRDTDLYFGTGSYRPESAAGLELLGRMIAQALTGVAGPVRPPGTIGDPSPDVETPPVVAPPPAVVPPATVPSDAAPATAEPPAAGVDAAGVGAAGPLDRADAEPAMAGAAVPAMAGAAVPAMAGAAVPVPLAGVPPAAPTDGRAEVELRIPAAPAAPPPAQAARIAGVAAGARRTARTAGTLPGAAASTEAARGAVAEPGAETAARAAAALTDALGSRPQPSPAIVALGHSIRDAIRSKRPVDEKKLVEADPRAMAAEAGKSMDAAVQADTQRVEGAYGPLQDPPAGSPQLTPQPVIAPPAGVAAPGTDAAAAAPDPIPAGDVSLDADRADVEAKVAAAGINRPSAGPIQEPPFSTVRAGQSELDRLAQTAPAEVLAKQDKALAGARNDMAGLQASALAALTASRSSTVAGGTAQQTAMVASEEQTRESVSRQAQQVFTAAQTRVSTMMAPLAATAMRTWTAGVERHSIEFRQSLDAVKKWIENRHSGVDGWIVSGVDRIAGLPRWVEEEYNRAEILFGDRIVALLVEISTDVNGVVAAAEAVIDDARGRIDALFAALPAGLAGWAAEQRATFGARLDGLHQQVSEARDAFERDLSKKAVAAVAAVQQEVEQLRTEARGVIGAVIDALAAFLDDPVRAIINGLLTLAGIAPPAFWALVAKIEKSIAQIADDPMLFVNHLVDALRAGFELFFANFPEHLLKGFFDWLFSALGSVGVQLPKDFSPRSIITFALQLMGITWPRVREILVRHIGEKNVALIEKAWTFVSTLIERGPGGIVDMLKERLDPATLLKQILDASIDYVVETLVKQVAIRIIGLLNPAGAVVQAVQLIYKVLKWLFENAARIFKLVETVVNGIADIIAGNIAGSSVAIEKALSSLLPIVIDFLAGFLGLGDLPLRVADIIKGLQKSVYEVLEAFIGWLVEKGRALLASLGLGGKDKEGDQAAGDTDLGTSVSFSGGDESHRQWVEAGAAGATLMVASTPMTVQQKLDDWAANPTRVPEDHRTEAGGLIGNARSLLGDADATADQLAAAYAAAAQLTPEEKAEPLPSDDPLEAGQRALATIMGRLFDLYGEHDEAEALRMIAAAMPSHADRYTGVVHSGWYERYVSVVKLGDEENAPALWARGDLDGTQAPALAAARSTEFHQPLVTYFTEAAGDREAATGEFYAYTFTRGGSPARQTFLDRLGSPAPGALGSIGIGRVDSTVGPGDTYKKLLRAKLAALGPGAYEIDIEPYGRLNLPTERIPDHTRFRPVNLTSVESDGTRVTRYATASGQSFVVAQPVTDGLSLTVQGAGLRIMRGRGVTQTPKDFTPGQNLNRAHVIANQFGGSGYKDAANLVTTSAHYNQTEMAGSEDSIINGLIQFAESNESAIEDVTFDLTVTVSFGKLLDAALLAVIKQQDWYPKGAPDLDAMLQQKVDEVLDAPLHRVTGVTYEWAASLPTGETTRASVVPRLGPDYWLLIEW